MLSCSSADCGAYLHPTLVLLYWVYPSLSEACLGSPCSCKKNDETKHSGVRWAGCVDNVVCGELETPRTRYASRCQPVWGSTYHGAFVRLPIGCVCLCGHSLGKDCLCPTLFPNCFHWGHTRARVPTQQTKLVKKQGRLVYLHDSTEGYRGVSERFCTSHAQAGSIDDNRSRERVRDLFFFFSLSSLLLSSLLFWKVPQNELGKVPQTN